MSRVAETKTLIRLITSRCDITVIYKLLFLDQNKSGFNFEV